MFSASRTYGSAMGLIGIGVLVAWPVVGFTGALAFCVVGYFFLTFINALDVSAKGGDPQQRRKRRKR